MSISSRLISLFLVLLMTMPPFAYSRQDVRVSPSAGATQTQPPAFTGRYPRYRVRAGDVLDLNFPFTPEFNQTVTIQPDGYISLRDAGDLQVQSKTTPELVEALRNAYGRILRDPVITVELKDFERPYFIVTGEVGRPGKYDLRGDITVVEAVAIAGDFKAQSKVSQVVIFRRVSDEWVETRQLDVKQMLRARNLGEDLHLRSGDMVYVPRRALAKLERFIPAPSVGMFLNPFNF